MLVIDSFRSKELKRFWVAGNAAGIKPDWRRKVGIVLHALEAARRANDLDVPGLGFHPLTGNLVGRYAVTVSRNWRITFGWAGEDAIDLDLEDYHGT